MKWDDTLVAFEGNVESRESPPRGLGAPSSKSRREKQHTIACQNFSQTYTPKAF